MIHFFLFSILAGLALPAETLVVAETNPGSGGKKPVLRNSLKIASPEKKPAVSAKSGSATGAVKTGASSMDLGSRGTGRKAARSLASSDKKNKAPSRKKASDEASAAGSARGSAIKPLVVQWEVSHSRNTDQVSLIFRQESAEFVANVSLKQVSGGLAGGGPSARLGSFVSLMTWELRQMKRRAEHCSGQLKNTVPLLSFIKYPRRLRPPPDPHAAVLTVGGETVHEKHPCFEILSRMLQNARRVITICMECASYKRKGGAIERTAKGVFSSRRLFKRRGAGGGPESGGNEEVKIFSEKVLDCIPKSGGKIECLDPQFGIFKI